MTPHAELHREEDIGLIEYFILLALLLLLACPARPLPSTPRGAPESPPAAPAGEPPSTADPDHIPCSTNPAASTQRRRTRHCFLPSPSELAVIVEYLRVGACPDPPLHQPLPRPKIGAVRAAAANKGEKMDLEGGDRRLW